MAFELISSDVFEKIKSNELQSNTLELLRDSLLPKLLSGELTITANSVKKINAEEVANV